MNDLSELQLIGYEPLSTSGFALPLYGQRARANTLYVAICTPPGDHNGRIVDFVPYQPSSHLWLAEDRHRTAKIGDAWLDVFTHEGQSETGTPIDIHAALRAHLVDLSLEIPLSILDLAIYADSPRRDEFARRARTMLQERFGRQRAKSWATDLVKRTVEVAIHRESLINAETNPRSGVSRIAVRAESDSVTMLYRLNDTEAEDASNSVHQKYVRFSEELGIELTSIQIIAGDESGHQDTIDSILETSNTYRNRGASSSDSRMDGYFRAPEQLGTSKTFLEPTLAFLSALRAHATDQQTTIDLSETLGASLSGTTLLIAELDRLKSRTTRPILIRAPPARAYNSKLRSFLLASERDSEPDRWKFDGIAAIFKSSSLGIDQFSKRIIQLLDEIYIEVSKKDLIHACINEAVNNVMLHANAHPPHPNLENATWWCGASTSPSRFVVTILDQGQGIRRSIQQTRQLSDPISDLEALVLALSAPPSAGDPRGSKGLRLPLRLIASENLKCSMQVVSGYANHAHVSARNGNSATTATNALKNELPGTLFLLDVAE